MLKDMEIKEIQFTSIQMESKIPCEMKYSFKACYKICTPPRFAKKKKHEFVTLVALTYTNPNKVLKWQGPLWSPGELDKSNMRGSQTRRS